MPRFNQEIHGAALAELIPVFLWEHPPQQLKVGGGRAVRIVVVPV
jgi:hypothetical protein